MIFILFANGGWIELDTSRREVVSSGEDWGELLLDRKPDPASMFKAVPVATLLELLMDEHIDGSDA